MTKLELMRHTAEEQKGIRKMNITITIERYNELIKKEDRFEMYADMVTKDKYATEIEKALFSVAEKWDAYHGEGDDF